MHTARNLRLYYQSPEVIASLIMKTSTSEWLGSDEFWLFCVEKDSYLIPLRECPSLAVNVRIVHVSPVNKPMVRRRILMANNNLEATLRTPLLMLINNACDFKVFTQFYSILKNIQSVYFCPEQIFDSCIMKVKTNGFV